MTDGQGFADAPCLSTDPALHTNRSTLHQILKPILAQNIGEPLRIQNRIDTDGFLRTARDLDAWNKLEHTDRIWAHPQTQPTVLDVDLVSIGVSEADVDAHHRLLIPE